jgi:alpha-L-fucosidase 2
LLPAIPDVWKSGSFTGLCVRGGAEVSARWTDHMITAFSLRATAAGHFKVKIPPYVKSIQLKVGDKITYLKKPGDFIDLSLGKGEQAYIAFQRSEG